jgi:outer membrane protein assembly factor BamD (BamD/ComL family)
MFRIKWLRTVSVVTLFFFVFFIGAADFSLAQKEEDKLMKARKLYQEGDYEGSIKLLSDFIQKLRAMVEQKKNVAEAFYLLAKIYFEVGDDAKVEENLQKVFETYPAFQKEETNFGFKERVEKVRARFLEKKEAEVIQQQEELIKKEKEIEAKPKPKVIEQPTPKKKKKKFPVVLVVVGLAVVAVLVILLAGGKKKEKEEVFDIRGDWTIFVDFGEGEIPVFLMTFNGTLNRGNFVDQDGDTGTYTVNRRNVNFEYDDFDIFFNGNFTDQNNMRGTVDTTLGVLNWRATRGFITPMSTSTYLKQAKTASKK